MTTEQKAKAYDEAIERAKKLQETCDSQAVVGWCEYILPELCESEDEKVRKAILELVRQSSEILDKQNQNNMIAWLEKQAEVESDDDIEAEEKDIRKAFNKIWDEKQGEHLMDC